MDSRTIPPTMHHRLASPAIAGWARTSEHCVSGLCEEMLKKAARAAPHSIAQLGQSTRKGRAAPPAHRGQAPENLESTRSDSQIMFYLFMKV